MESVVFASQPPQVSARPDAAAFFRSRLWSESQIYKARDNGEKIREAARLLDAAIEHVREVIARRQRPARPLGPTIDAGPEYVETRATICQEAGLVIA